MDFESMVKILAVYEDRWDVHVIMDVTVEGDLETLLLDGVLSRTENEIHGKNYNNLFLFDPRHIKIIGTIFPCKIFKFVLYTLPK